MSEDRAVQVAQAESLFPSGPWSGYYVHHASPQRHGMHLGLRFADGLVDGSGSDDIGPFTVKGHYDRETLVVTWTKSYPASHDVGYRGYREGRGIWGTWEIRAGRTGGFLIWPGDGAAEGAQAASRSEGTASPAPFRP